MIYIFIGILIASFILAVRSMKDLTVPKEIQAMLTSRKIKGTILFVKDQIKHYSSTSSSSSE
ncbi:MAG: hypothetical protein Q7S61_01425 [bacterium]|nr:hypothetical protein [bacterium]